MKFIVKRLTKCAPRLGVITEVERLPDMKLETPMALLYTKGGSIPHITHEVFQLVTDEPQAIQVPIVSTISFNEALADWNGSLAEFVGLKECLSYITVHDPGSITPGGHHLHNNVPLWTRSGKIYMNPERYMDTMEAFKPDIYCTLSDGDTNIVSAKKRISKAVDQTLSFFSKCIERHNSSSRLKNSMVLASVAGGYCLKSRERCIKQMIEENNSVGGYFIDGLHNNGPEVEFVPFGEVKPVVEHIINLLPEDKMRVIHGCWNPVNVIRFVAMGIDMFDNSYVNIVTERSAALIFNFDEDLESDGCYEINMRDSKFVEDFDPLVTGCACLTCDKYTRSYIHHLINVQELLGPILLTIHNTHHYLEFFKKIRQSIENGTLENLERLVQKQFDDHQNKITGIDTVTVMEVQVAQ